MLLTSLRQKFYARALLTRCIRFDSFYNVMDVQHSRQPLNMNIRQYIGAELAL